MVWNGKALISLGVRPSERKEKVKQDTDISFKIFEFLYHNSDEFRRNIIKKASKVFAKKLSANGAAKNFSNKNSNFRKNNKIKKPLLLLEAHKLNIDEETNTESTTKETIPNKKTKRSKRTHQDIILSALKTRKKGATARQIIEYVQKKNLPIPKKSVYAHLSTMKKADIITNAKSEKDKHMRYFAKD